MPKTGKEGLQAGGPSRREKHKWDGTKKPCIRPATQTEVTAEDTDMPPIKRLLMLPMLAPCWALGTERLVIVAATVDYY